MGVHPSLNTNITLAPLDLFDRPAVRISLLEFYLFLVELFYHFVIYKCMNITVPDNCTVQVSFFLVIRLYIIIGNCYGLFL